MLGVVEKEKKRKHCAFWRQFIEKPSIIPGCPDWALFTCRLLQSLALLAHKEWHAVQL